MVLTLLAMLAHGGTDDTRDALDRMEEVLELRIEEGTIRIDEVMPAILVSASPRYEESLDWFSIRSIEIIQTAFGDGGLRICEACMAPRAFVEDAHMVYQTGPIGIDEVIRLDDRARGSSSAAKSAIWVTENAHGVSMRIVDLRTSKVLFAQNIDPNMRENKRSKKIYSLAAELERRARGDGLAQAFIDIVVYPGQHISLDWTDQWGKRNNNLTGVTLSVFDPLIGIGATHARRFRFLNLLVGLKATVSLPTAAARALTQAGSDFELIDPLMTMVVYTRIPIGRSNYGIVASASTNGNVGIGISLMNITFIPILP